MAIISKGSAYKCTHYTNIALCVVFSSEEEEQDVSYDSDEGQDIKTQPPRDITSSSAMTGPTPSSVVKLEANQKARNKKERQELYGETAL